MMKLNNININFSIWNKTLKLKLNEHEYDLTNMVSSEIWNIGGKTFPKIIEDEWKIATKLCSVVREFIKEYDEDVTNKDICFRYIGSDLTEYKM